MKEQEIENTSFYYNRDGLPDSTRNMHFGTFRYIRTKKGENKLIEMKNSIAEYRWFYNPSGECIRTETISKGHPYTIRESGYKGDLKTKINYYYNQNGTLSKVTTKRSDKPEFVRYYSYFY